MTQKTGAEPFCTSFSVLLRRNFGLRAPFGAARFRSQKRPSWTAFSHPASQWRLSPPFVRPPQKSSAFPGSHIFQSSGGQSPPSGKKISGFQPEILLGRAVWRGSLSLAKEAELDGFQPPSFAMAAFAAICSASFLLWPLPEPTGVPFRSTSTKKRLSWSGPSSPVRRYFSTWPLSRWTSS